MRPGHKITLYYIIVQISDDDERKSGRPMWRCFNKGRKDSYIYYHVIEASSTWWSMWLLSLILCCLWVYGHHYCIWDVDPSWVALSALWWCVIPVRDLPQACSSTGWLHDWWVLHIEFCYLVPTWACGWTSWCVHLCKVSERNLDFISQNFVLWIHLKFDGCSYIMC